MTSHSTGTDIDLLELHRRSLDEFDRRIRAVRADQWTDSTPCSEWDVRALVNHLVVEQLWVPPLMAGQTIAEVGDRLDGDQLGDDPVSTWERAAHEARTAFTAPGALEETVHLSAGDTEARVYCEQMTFDATVHAWDLARGIGVDDTIDAELASAMFGLMRTQAEEWRKYGLFAAEVDVSAGADVQSRLLAMTGRRR
jgi:uncharacterized protein (TIGR03086 family)